MLVGYGPAAGPASRRRRSGRAHRDRTVQRRRKKEAARPLAAPPVRFMARQQGVDLADVAGHGPDGIITREDLAAHLADGPVPRPSRDGPGRESRVAGPWRAEAHGRGDGPQCGHGAPGLRVPHGRRHADGGAGRSASARIATSRACT